LITNQGDCSQKHKKQNSAQPIRFIGQLLTPKIHITTTHYSSGKLN